MSTHVFGIISWFPNKQPDRALRQERINRFLRKINELWPTSDILIVAQNWDTFKPVNISNKIIIDNHEIGLGILGARKRLREVFLQHKEYDYLIMADDDCLLDTTKQDAIKFTDQLNIRKDGFLILEELAQLNLCCVSQYIYEIEPMVDLDPQKNEGYEDLVFTQLLKHKYTSHEINNSANIRCLQFNKAPHEKAPSTWSNGNVSNNLLMNRSNFFLAAFKAGDFDMKALKEASKKAFPDSANISPYNVFSNISFLANAGNVAYSTYKQTHKENSSYTGNPFLNDYLRK